MWCPRSIKTFIAGIGASLVDTLNLEPRSRRVAGSRALLVRGSVCGNAVGSLSLSIGAISWLDGPWSNAVTEARRSWPATSFNRLATSRRAVGDRAACIASRSCCASPVFARLGPVWSTICRIMCARHVPLEWGSRRPLPAVSLGLRPMGAEVAMAGSNQGSS